MLYIHTSRENYNKEKFVFETIKGNAIVLVPDQYTIQAEKDAFFYTKKKALMDLEVLSFSRLIDRVFQQAGGDRIPMLDPPPHYNNLQGVQCKVGTLSCCSV